MRCPPFGGHLALLNKRKTMRKISPPTLMLVCMLGMIALDWLLPIMVFYIWLLLILGMISIAFGLVIGFGAEGQFRRRGTTIDPKGTPSTLVTDGWFQYSRNPMYLSFLLILIGAWLALGSLTPFLGIPIFVLLIERSYIRPEEQRLVVAFGGEYQSYLKRTRHWL